MFNYFFHLSVRIIMLLWSLYIYVSAFCDVFVVQSALNFEASKVKEYFRGLCFLTFCVQGHSKLR